MFCFQWKECKSRNSQKIGICDVNIIGPEDLVPKWGNICLGEGSYGKCLLKFHKRLNIPVVEKQVPNIEMPQILQETKIMQSLSHPNIPTVFGVQLEKTPLSIIMEFVGKEQSSITVHKLLDDHRTVSQTQWFKVCYNVADALQHMHNKGFLHCDLKSNNIVVSIDKDNYCGYLIDFGKACHATSPPAKRYSTHYPHIAPEVLTGGPCSQKSDIFSFGTVLQKIGSAQNINIISEIGNNCCAKTPHKRPSLSGVLSSLAMSLK